MADNNIQLKSIQELLELKFFIPNYQRGYRWTEQQVKDLLDDIRDFSSAPHKEYEYYCLQPLVVRTMSQEDKIKNDINPEETWFEVIDGQQRLTTLYLILTSFKDAIETLDLPSELFEIRYQRKTGEFDGSLFLENITELNAVDNSQIDYYHMSAAYFTIKSWIKKNTSKESRKKVNKGEFCNALLKYQLDDDPNNPRDKANNVRFIWYESVDEDPIKVFTRLNIGKISLTNAELIKALFLNRSNFNSGDDQYLELKQMEIANEWDTIEYTLQNDEFWLFLNQRNYDRPTRIDFLFDLIFEHNSLNLDPDSIGSFGSDAYSTFRYFYEYFSTGRSSIKDCWEEVKKPFRTFQEWFNNSEQFHYVGFLVDCDTSISDLLREWEQQTEKQGFIQILKSRIKEKIAACPSLEFQYKDDGSNKGKCKPILLFHNIQTVINQNLSQIRNEKYNGAAFFRFPFHLYKSEGWDVEHINSNTSNPESDVDTQKEWLLNVYLSADTDVQEHIRKACESKDNDEISACYAQTKKIFPFQNDWSVEEKNRIGNYTLLDSSTNRSYGNAIFSAKRRIIIGKDKGQSISVPKFSRDGQLITDVDKAAESSFVPPCTKQVFLKYYSAATGNNNYWTKEDAAAYLKDIADCIAVLNA